MHMHSTLPPQVLGFDEWVFNTEAHPFRLAQGAQAASATVRRRTLSGSQDSLWR